MTDATFLRDAAAGRLKSGHARMALGLFLAAMLCLVAVPYAQGQEISAEQQRGVTDPPGARLFKDRYLFGPIMVRSLGQRIHMQFYRGEDHLWKGRATIGYAVSDDDGRTWQERPDIVAAKDPEVYDRFASFGRARNGRLITLFSRRVRPGTKPLLYTVHSNDDGETWSKPAPAKVTAGDGREPIGGWMQPYGKIKRSAEGTLAAMTYVGVDNFVLISRDHGETWASRLVISSKQPNYSEMGLEMLTKTHWIAVSRIDGQMSRMAIFESQDAGESWALKGPLEIEESSKHVAPSIDTFNVLGRRVVMLSYCDRRPQVCWVHSADTAPHASGLPRWGAKAKIDSGIFGRSGYQSLLQSHDGRDLIIAMTRERSEKISDIVVWRIPLTSILN
jgi:hypothetical protein